MLYPGACWLTCVAFVVGALPAHKPLAHGARARVPAEAAAAQACGEEPPGPAATDLGLLDAARHAIRASAAGHEADNPGQGWRTRFDGRGFESAPREGGWSFGLALTRWGFAGCEAEAGSAAEARAEGQRLVYRRSSALDEWYVNDGRGLEHGYTVRERPARGDGWLCFALAVRGGLEPRAQAGGRGVTFLDQAGRERVRYAGLVAFDADGRELEARIACSPGRIELQVDERGARYPLTIDPVSQRAYVKASNVGANDMFGHAIAASGDTLVVGAPFESSATAGVDGNQTNDDTPRSGAAYVFVRTPRGWSQQAYLKASNTGSDDFFGWSVAISGDTVVVGAWGESSDANGVDGVQGDDSAPRAGAAYVFVRSGSSWSQEAYLKASNSEGGDSFGHALAISGESIAVGAPGESSSATGANGSQANEDAHQSGAVYVFTRNGSTWSQQAYLKPSNTGADDAFGTSVALDGDTLAVGSPREDSSATGIGGNDADDGANDSGAAYVFTRAGTAWSQQAYLKASNTGVQDDFGRAVALSGGTLLVGAPGEDSGANDVNGDQTNDAASSAGAVYAFALGFPTWTQQAYLKASNCGPDDAFGTSVGLAGQTAVVGAYREDSASNAVDGPQGDESAANAGAAYVFARHGARWGQRAYLKASNSGANDLFGWSVSVAGDFVFAGAPREASGSTQPTDESAPNAGALYAYGMAEDTQPFCFGDGSASACPCGNGGAPGRGCANATNPAGARLATEGWPSLTQDELVLLGDGMPNGSAFYFQGTAELAGGAGAPFGDGLRCAGGALAALRTVPNRGGASHYPRSQDPPISMRGQVNVPGTRTYQIWYRNSASYCTSDRFNFSNGVSVTWVP